MSEQIQESPSAIARFQRETETPEDRVRADDANLEFTEKIQAQAAEDSLCDEAHRAKFRCDGCGNPLLYRPAYGLDDQIYHEGICAANARAAHGRNQLTEKE